MPRERASKDMAFQREWVGNLGWGVTRPDFQVTERHCLPEKPFQWSLEKGTRKDEFFLEASGWHPDKLDTWLGLPYHQLDQLSIREQRKIVKQRVEQILKMKAQQRHDNNIPLTRPIDNAQNTLLHRKQQARVWASL